jgi:hypothetical protein
MHTPGNPPLYKKKIVYEIGLKTVHIEVGNVTQLQSYSSLWLCSPYLMNILYDDLDSWVI